MNNLIVEILPNLWLSSYKYALDEKFIKDKKIKVILNCTKNIKFINLPNIKKIRISVNDSLKHEDIVSLYNYLPSTVDLIEKHMNNMEPMIIHCYAGQQRSATVIAAFLIKNTNLTYLESIIFIQSKKKNAFKPGINFSNSLKKYEEDIKSTY